MQGTNQLFDHPKPIIGVVHLLPLIGSPQSRRSFREIRTRTLSDAATLIDNGINGVIIENYGDAPFLPDSVEPHTVAALALIADEDSRAPSPDTDWDQRPAKRRKIGDGNCNDHGRKLYPCKRAYRRNAHRPRYYPREGTRDLALPIAPQKRS